MRVTTIGDRISFESDESVLKLDSSDGCMIFTHYKAVNFMFYELYFNNNPLKCRKKREYILCVTFLWKKKGQIHVLTFAKRNTGRIKCKTME